jgi:hypothetical protein
MIPYGCRRREDWASYTHRTILTQPHTEASGSIIAHFQIEQLGSMMPQPHTGSHGPIFPQTRIGSTGANFAQPHSGSSGPILTQLQNWAIGNDLASNAHWVIRADLYPSAARVTGHDSGEIVRGGRNPTDAGEADTIILASMNLPSAARERNSITAHRTPWHRGQGEVRSVFCGQSTEPWQLPCEGRQGFVRAW